MTINRDHYLTTGQAAQRMGVTAKTIRAWIEAGRLPSLRTPSGRYLIHKDDAVLARVQPPK